MTLGSHQATIGKSQVWVTPKWLLERLGHFDLDPAGADPRPWDCAETTYTTCGLDRDWFGQIFLNPPFNRYEVGWWVNRLALHGHGVALLHARTEAAWFDPVWDHADAILHLADRLYFHYPDGTRAKANSGAPAVLCAFGAENVERLRSSGIAGRLVIRWERVGGA